MENTEASITHFFRTLEWFRSISGLSLNYDKTTIYRLKDMEEAKAEMYTTLPVKWSSGSMNILGVEVNGKRRYCTATKTMKQ